MKKNIFLSLLLIIMSITTYTYGSNIINYVTESGNHESITIVSGEEIVFSFSKKIEEITFSKDSGFTIRTLEGGVWRDVSNSISDYNPITGFLVRNISEGDLLIEATYKNVTTIEDSIFQKTLQAGWNLIGPAYKNEGSHNEVSLFDALGESLPFSQLLDFTGNGFYDGNETLVYSGEAAIGTSTSHNVDINNYAIKSKSEMQGKSLFEKLAYGVFVNVDSVISGSQELTIDEEIVVCDEVSQLLGLCGAATSEQIAAANELADRGLITDYSGDINSYNLLMGISNSELNSIIDLHLSENFSATGSISLSKIESLYIISDRIFGSGFTINDTDVNWEADTVTFAVEKGITPSFTNYTNTINKGDTYSYLNNAIVSFEGTTLTCDEVSELLGLCTNASSVSLIPIADISVMRGTSDVVALQFEVEADDTEKLISITEVGVEISATGSTFASNLEIADIKLYKDSATDSNLLETIAGSNLNSTGQILFNSFPMVNVGSGTVQQFVVSVSIVDSSDAVNNGTYNVRLNTLNVEDTINGTNSTVGDLSGANSTRDITVNDYGVVSITEDSNNADNEDNKVILAGNTGSIFSVDIQSINESMDIQTVIFDVNYDLKDEIVNASLYLDDILIDINSNSDISSTQITFDNLTTLISEQATQELKLVLNTSTIGYQKVGHTITGIQITNVALNNVTGVTSGGADSNKSLSVTSKLTDIIPAILVPALVTGLSSSATPEISINANVGANTINESNSIPNVVVTQVVLSTLGSNIDAASSGAVFSIFNLDDSNVTATASIIGSTLTFDLSGLANNATVSDGIAETFKVSVTGLNVGSNPDTLALKLLQDGITYDVINSNGDLSNANSTGLNIQLSNELDFGSRQY